MVEMYKIVNGKASPIMNSLSQCRCNTRATSEIFREFLQKIGKPSNMVREQ